MSFAHSLVTQIWSSLLITLLFFHVFLSGFLLVIFCKSTKFSFLSFFNIRYFIDVVVDFSLIHISGSALKSLITINFLLSFFSLLIYLNIMFIISFRYSFSVSLLFIYTFIIFLFFYFL